MFAAYTSVVTYAEIETASSTIVTTRFNAPFPTVMSYAEIGCAFSTIVTTRFSAPFPTAVKYALVGTGSSMFGAPIGVIACFYFALLTPLPRLRIFGYGLTVLRERASFIHFV